MVCLALPRFGFRDSRRWQQSASLPNDVRLKIDRIFKGVTRQGEQGVALVNDLSLTLQAGDCVGLTGPSLIAKTVLLQILQGQSRVDAGAIWIANDGQWINLAQLSRLQLQSVCHQTVGYLGQVLPTSPRATAFEMVLDPLLERGNPRRAARETASRLLTQVNVPRRLWRVSPMQFSKVEQQRVNVARTFAVDYPVYVLNAPMMHLTPSDRLPLLELIEQHKNGGSAFIGLFHDQELQLRACTRTLGC